MLSSWVLGTTALVFLSSDTLVHFPGFKLYCRELKQNTPSQGQSKKDKHGEQGGKEKKKYHCIQDIKG